MKFEMNKETLWMLKMCGGLIVNKGLIERKMTLFDIPVVINSNKPNGIVQLGRDSIILNYTDNIRASLESLVRVAKMREGGPFDPSNILTSRSREVPEALHRVNVNSVFGVKGSFDKEDYLQVFRGDTERASGRTFRALLDVMKTASESPEGSLTVFVSLNETCQNREYYMLASMVSQGINGMVRDTATRTLILPGNRRITVVTKNQSSKITEACQVVYDHTVQRG